MSAKYIAVAIFLALLACSQARKPNIMVLITDDQDVMLGSMEVMNFTRQLIIKQGISFTNAFTTTPICCPSRSSILTGLYAHNHHVYTNNANCSSILWQRFYESKSYATYLNRSGYHTGFFGKYLNEYNGTYTPPGWGYWMGLIKNSKYYNYTLFHNGTKEVHGDNYEEDYLTDLVTNRSMEFFRRAKAQAPERPVLSVVSFPAPHGPEDGAPQYQDLYKNPTSHKTKSFNYTPNPEKHWIVKLNGEKMDKNQLQFSKILQQKRLQTLRSVDDSIKKIVDMLQELQELDNTYILYFSDHGYHIGQFGLAKGKSQPYDFDTRIPFLIRGPDIPRNKILTKIALNIDVAPTILGMAGVPIPVEMDGRNLLDLFNDDRLADQPWRDSFLIERGKMPRNRTQLIKPKLRTKVERLAELCESPNYASPCEPDQYWTCLVGRDGKRRLQKCKKKPPKQKTRPSSPPKRRKLCPCPKDQHTWSPEGTSAEEINVLQTCDRRFRSSALRNPRSRRNHLSKRNSYFQHMKDLQNRAHRGYNKLRNEKTFNRRRFKRDATESTAGASRKNSTSASKPFMVLTSSCRLYMPNFEITCMPDLYNDPIIWVKHMGHLARSVKTLQLRMKYMKTLRKCLNTYDEMIKTNSRMCECPTQPPRPKVTKPKVEHRENFSHPLFDLSAQEDRALSEQKRIYYEQKETVRLIKDIRRAKLEKNADREQKGRTRVNRCSSKGATCFLLNSNTWAVKPKWEGENRCYCTNSNNNTYWCVRIINENTNVLYCQFITGLREYYDMNKDQYQLVSAVLTLPEEEKAMYEEMVGKLRGCKGDRNCTLPPFSNPYAVVGSRLSVTESYRRNGTNQEVLEMETPQERGVIPPDSHRESAVAREQPGTRQDGSDMSSANSPRKEQRDGTHRTPDKQAKGTRQRKRQGGSKQSKASSQGRRSGKRKAFEHGQTERPKKKQTSQAVSFTQTAARPTEEEEEFQSRQSSQRSHSSGHRRMGRPRNSKAEKNARSKKKGKNLIQ